MLAEGRENVTPSDVSDWCSGTALEAEQSRLAESALDDGCCNPLDEVYDVMAELGGNGKWVKVRKARKALVQRNTLTELEALQALDAWVRLGIFEVDVQRQRVRLHVLACDDLWKYEPATDTAQLAEWASTFAGEHEAIKAMDKMIVLDAQADPTLLEAAADAHHKTIGSSSGKNCVTSKPREAINAIDNMIVLDAQADPKLLEAAADAHQKTLGSSSGENGVTAEPLEAIAAVEKDDCFGCSS